MDTHSLHLCEPLRRSLSEGDGEKERGSAREATQEKRELMDGVRKCGSKPQPPQDASRGIKACNPSEVVVWCLHTLGCPVIFFREDKVTHGPKDMATDVVGNEAHNFGDCPRRADKPRPSRSSRVDAMTW